MSRFIYPGSKAQGSIRFGADPLDGETQVIGDRTYTYKTVATDAFHVVRGGGAAVTAANLIAKVNAAATKPSAGISAEIDDVDNTLVHLFADAVGRAGNVAISDTVAAGGYVLSGAALTNGEEPDFQTVVPLLYTVTANDVAATNLRIKTPLTSPQVVQSQYFDANGEEKESITDRLTVTGDIVKIAFNGATHLVAGDTVKLLLRQIN